jgi:hypothetical protein
VDVKQANPLVAVIAALSPGDLADATVAQGALRLPVAIVGRPVGADLQHLFVTPDGVTQLDRLFDGVRHRLFAVDMLARFERVAGDLRVPMIGRGDQHGVDIFAIKQLAIVAVALAFRDGLGPRDSAPIDVADRHHIDVVGLGPLDQAGDVTGSLAANANDPHANAAVGTQRRGGGYARHGHGSGRCDRSSHELSTRKIGVIRHGRTFAERGGCGAG